MESTTITFIKIRDLEIGHEAEGSVTRICWSYLPCLLVTLSSCPILPHQIFLDLEQNWCP